MRDSADTEEEHGTVDRGSKPKVLKMISREVSGKFSKSSTSNIEKTCGHTKAK